MNGRDRQMLVRTNELGIQSVYRRLHSMYVRAGSMGSIQKKPFS